MSCTLRKLTLPRKIWRPYKVDNGLNKTSSSPEYRHHYHQLSKLLIVRDSNLITHRDNKPITHRGSNLITHRGSNLITHRDNKPITHRGSNLITHRDNKAITHRDNKPITHRGSNLIINRGNKPITPKVVILISLASHITVDTRGRGTSLRIIWDLHSSLVVSVFTTGLCSKLIQLFCREG